MRVGCHRRMSLLQKQKCYNQGADSDGMHCVSAKSLNQRVKFGPGGYVNIQILHTHLQCYTVAALWRWNKISTTCGKKVVRPIFLSSLCCYVVLDMYYIWPPFKWFLSVPYQKIPTVSTFGRLLFQYTVALNHQTCCPNLLLRRQYSVAERSTVAI